MLYIKKDNSNDEYHFYINEENILSLYREDKNNISDLEVNEELKKAIEVINKYLD